MSSLITGLCSNHYIGFAFITLYLTLTCSKAGAMSHFFHVWVRGGEFDGKDIITVSVCGGT